MGITVSCNHFKDTVIDSQDGDIKGTTSQIEHEDILFSLLLIKTVGDSSCCRLIQDSNNIQPRDCSSVLCSLPLGVVKISWNCDHGIDDFLPQVGF